MFSKSDIEAILETQTWKKRRIICKNSSQAKSLRRTLKPLDLPTVRISLIEKDSQSPKKIVEKNRKSILSVPYNLLLSRISNKVNKDEINLIKIPSFPTLPFGLHSKMLNTIPTFEEIPNDAISNIGNIMAIKRRSGRIKKVVGKSISTARLQPIGNSTLTVKHQSVQALKIYK